MSKPVDVSPEEFEAEVLQVSEKPVLVDFWSETCGHCLTLNPQYEAAADENEDVKFAKVSFQQAKDLFKEHGVRATPTLILFSDGEEVARTVGAKRADELNGWLTDEMSD
ncbi:MAG: thioredoxin fold domain-containing protein [Armatimonadia bacterium]|nr:thioredoxin fold domain-containing protein [Armatimonadia bacterium]